MVDLIRCRPFGRVLPARRNWFRGEGRRQGNQARLLTHRVSTQTRRSREAHPVRPDLQGRPNLAADSNPQVDTEP